VHAVVVLRREVDGGEVAAHERCSYGRIATQQFQHGHSVGHWEGKVLVVETTNFTDHKMGLSTGVPSSSQKKLIERFALNDDGKSLTYSGTIDDPVYLTQQAQWSGRLEYRPGMPQSNQKCNVDVARKFLSDY